MLIFGEYILMANKQRKFHFLFFIVFSLFLILLPGCSTVKEQDERSESYKGQFSLFLNGPERASFNITFDLSAVIIVSEDGIPREIMDNSISINSFIVKGNQILLSESSIPEGKYNKIRLIVKRANIKRKGVEVSLALPPEGIEIPVNVSVKRQQNTSLFVSWNADASFIEGYLFDPSIAVKVEKPELRALLIYVTNEGSDNVSVIDRLSGKVVATIMVGKRPKGIAIASDEENSRVYVANSGSNSVSVIDPTTNKVEQEIPVMYGSGPEGVAVARLSSEKQLVYVANYDSNSVSVIETENFQEIDKVQVDQGPIALAADPDIEAVTGTRFLNFEDITLLRNYREKFINVYVVNQNSNNVSVLVIDVLKSKCVEVINLDVEWEPVALTVDYQRGKVYVANYNADNISVIDIIEIIKGNRTDAVSVINNEERYITGIITDPVFDRIYLLKKKPGQIMIIRPFLEDFDALKTVKPPIMGTIEVGKSPRSFLLDSEVRKLYVVNSGSNSISVVDKTTKKEERIIPVGRKPYGIAIFQENN
jgi:YVTN family beta-propeller protein